MSSLIGENYDVQAAEPIKEVKELVKEIYYPGITSTSLNGAKTIDQLMKKLDPYSVFMTTEEMKKFESDIALEFVGIGVTIIENKKGLAIVEVVKNSPAEKGGIRKGDIITKVNGISLASKKLDEAVALLQGKAKTTVKVTFYRPKTKKETTRSIIRAKITMENVEAKKLAGGVGYIRLNSFSEKSASELQKEMKKMPSVRQWIFDLRGNGGGYIEAAEAVIGMFPNAQIAYLQKYAKDNNYYYQVPQKQKTQFKGSVAILIDKNSASASEMTAAATKGQKLATLYGQTSFGKGVAQSIFELENKKGYVKLTMAEFFGMTSKGSIIKINKVGITPNVKTAIGQEVIVSHGAFLKKSLAKSSVLPSTVIPSTKQEITIKPSSKITWSQLKTAKFSLYQWGGVTRKITVKKGSGQQMKITAPAGMKKGTKYYLNINPSKGKSAYTYVRVN